MTQPFFIIYRDEIELARIADSNYDSHKHDYEELIIITDGTVEHFIDFKKSSFTAPAASFVTKGKIHKIVPKLDNGPGRLWVLQFKSEFVPETAFHLYSYYHDNATIALQPGPRLEKIIALCEMMQFETRQTVPEFGVVRHLLTALLTMIESEWRKSGAIDDVPQKNTNTFKSFLQILEENFCKSDGVDFYAEKLSMTTRNLNLICQNIWQKSVSEIIEDRKLIEAKNLLINTEKTVVEIGIELGYNEKSYFANVFKKKSGQTPGEFRREMKKLVS